MYKIRHRKIMKSYPVLIGTTPLYFPPSAPPLHNVVSNPSISHTNESAIMPVPTSSYLPAGDQRQSVVPEQPSSYSIGIDIRKEFINNLCLIYRKKMKQQVIVHHFSFSIQRHRRMKNVCLEVKISEIKMNLSMCLVRIILLRLGILYSTVQNQVKSRIHYETIEVVLILK